ncbi:MAG: hypothetical protein HUU17_12915 [Chthonomonadales bacterium]|nr:hypothetical protein [Chthonomonadales bacterium]
MPYLKNIRKVYITEADRLAAEALGVSVRSLYRYDYTRGITLADGRTDTYTSYEAEDLRVVTVTRYADGTLAVGPVIHP